MSKLERLIEELCPEGVEYRAISEIANITRGRVMSKEYIKSNYGIYPVYSSQTENNGELGTISTYDFDGEYITWTTDGANAGSIFYRNEKFSITNVCGLIETKSKQVLVKFVYYYLSIVSKKYVNYGMGNPKLMSNVMSRIQIPLPPLPIQEEIVRILDSFTELKAQLEDELEARKKQYEWYRDTFLNFNNNVIKKSLSDLCIISAGGDIPKNALSNEKDSFHKIPVISNGVGENAIYGYTTVPKITVSAVTIAARGTIGYAAYRDYPYFPIIRLLSVIPINNLELNTKFLYYCLEGKKYNIPQAGIPQLTVPTLKKVIIPLPPLEEQQRIVDILDRFDKLCNDISEGLPAEIDARQKQYEYYRDKLLTFKRLGE